MRAKREREREGGGGAWLQREASARASIAVAGGGEKNSTDSFCEVLASVFFLLRFCFTSTGFVPFHATAATTAFMRTLLLPFFSYSRLLPSFSAIDAKTIIVRVPLIQLLVCVRVYTCIASRLVVENWFLFFSREVAWLLWSCETCRSTKQLEHVLVEDPAVFLLHSPKRHFFVEETYRHFALFRSVKFDNLISRYFHACTWSLSRHELHPEWNITFTKKYAFCKL